MSRRSYGIVQEFQITPIAPPQPNAYERCAVVLFIYYYEQALQVRNVYYQPRRCKFFYVAK